MSKQHIQIGGIRAEVDLDRYWDLSIPVAREGVSAWNRGRAEIRPYQTGNFTGSIRAGAAVNFNDIAFNPHAHGTHTESLGHITEEGVSLLSDPPPPWMLARLVSVRTYPNPTHKTQRDWSGSHPPYLHPDTLAKLAKQGILHVLVDLPSVDPEEDGGALRAHKAFWGLPDSPRQTATITEMIYVPDAVPDGLYLLNLQFGAFENDACPSRPLIFPIDETQEA